MTSRERVIRTLKFQEVDRMPRDLWILESIPMFRNDDLQAVHSKYPMDITQPEYSYGKGKRCKGVPYRIGESTDAWGCEWQVAEDGVIGEVRGYPLADWSALDTYAPPWELLAEADLSKVNAFCANTDKFVLVWTETRPFERMQFLRGTENIMMDLAYDEPEIYKLRDLLQAFFVKEMELWANTDVDGVIVMDDWGSQNALLISPETWRAFFKPLYKEYADILHSSGKYMFFHSDGNIEAIYPDLVELGVDEIGRAHV